MPNNHHALVRAARRACGCLACSHDAECEALMPVLDALQGQLDRLRHRKIKCCRCYARAPPPHGAQHCPCSGGGWHAAMYLGASSGAAGPSRAPPQYRLPVAIADGSTWIRWTSSQLWPCQRHRHQLHGLQIWSHCSPTPGRHPPSTHTIGAATSALEQDRGRCRLESRYAAHPSFRLATDPAAGIGRRDEEGRAEPARRMPPTRRQDGSS